MSNYVEKIEIKESVYDMSQKLRIKIPFRERLRFLIYGYKYEFKIPYEKMIQIQRRRWW